MKSLGRAVHTVVALATLALATAALPSPAAANLLVNPGFEDGAGSYNGWFTFGSGVQMSTPATDNIAHAGVAAAKIYGGFTGSFNVGGFGQAFTSPVVGNTYTLSGWAYVASGDPIPGTDVCASNRLIAKIVYFSALAGGTELQSNEIVIAGVGTPTNTWVPFTVATPCPTGALRVEALFLYLQPGMDPGSAFVDDVSFLTSATPAESNVLNNPSFTTGLTGWTTFGNVYPENRAAEVRTRTGSAKLFSTFDPGGAPSGMFQTTTAAPGDIWEFGGWALNTCMDGPITGINDNYMTAKLVYRDALFTEIGTNEARLADNTTPLGTWKRGLVSMTAPAGTAYVDAYILFISPSLYGGSFWVDDVFLRKQTSTGVGTPAGLTLALASPTPNPFRAITRLDWSLPQRGPVDVSVFDVAGRRVATLFHGEAAAGPHVSTWDGRHADGRVAAAGVYRAVLRSGANTQVRSLVLAR